MSCILVYESNFFDTFHFIQQEGFNTFLEGVVQSRASDAGTMDRDVDDIVFQFNEADITAVVLNIWSDLFDRFFNKSDFFFQFHIHNLH